MSGARGWRFRTAILFGSVLLLTVPNTVSAAPPARPAPVPVGPGVATATSWIVSMQPRADTDRLAGTLAQGEGGKAGFVFRHALHGFVFKGSAKAAAALARNPNVRSVVADGTIHALDDTIPTGISRIAANHSTPPSAYDAGFTGQGVRVAILDTGIDLTHPDLVPNLDVGLGKNCMTAGPPQDGHGHGTHVAGIIAAADNGLGVVGVAPHARLVPFKVLDDSGSGEWSNLICAIDTLTAYATDNDPTNDIRVANMSLGDVGTIGTCTDGGVREAICKSVAAGVTYVAAAGNSTVDVSGFIPAAFPEVIAVSAVTDLDGEPGGLGGCWLFFFYCDDTLAEFSNFGTRIDVTAPGTQITSDWTGGGYATEMGTSMASPHVAGVAALLLAAFPNLTPADVRDRLKSTGQCPNGAFADANGSGDCVGKGQWGNDRDGVAEPLVNALNAVSGGNPGDRRPTVQITAPLDGATVSGPIVVTATATDDVGVAKVDFFVNGRLAASDTDGSNGWTMPWDANSVDGGAYTFTATATDTAGQTRSHTVSVRTAANAQGNWVGTYGHDGYVLANWTGNNADLSSLPAGVTFSLDQGGRYVWAATTTEVRALQSPTMTERRSMTWYDTSSLRLHLTFANAYTGTLHLYALDWDAYGGNRFQNVTINDGHGAQTAQLGTAYVQGAWIHAPINVAAGGTVTITADKTAGNTAVLAGLFLGGAGPLPPPPPPPPPAPTVDLPGVQGNWLGTYGADGYVFANWNGSNDLVSLPAGVTYSLEQGARYTWAASTTDVRALRDPSGNGRKSLTWYDANQIRIRLTFAAAYTGTLHLYALDWDAYGPRGEDVSIDDGAGRRTASLAAGSYVQGAWVHAPFAVGAGGSVVITVDRTASNAVLAGLLLGGPGALPPPPPPPLPVDSPGVQGNWVGTYGHDGYVLANWTGNNADLSSLPAGVTFSLDQGGRYVWAATTTEVRALQSPTMTERRSMTWYDTSSLRLHLTFANAYTGTLHLYALDWDAYGGNRFQNVTINDGHGAQTAQLGTAYVQGAWIHAPINVAAGGTVTITADKTAGNTAVLAGLFLGDGSTPPPPPPPPTAPGAPTGLVATPGNGQVGLTWVAPASTGGSPITGYTATASPGGATCTAGGSTFNCTVTGLTNGTPYTFTVVAANAVGPGPASAPASATPVAPPPPPTAPGAPTGLVATPGNGQVGLTWVAPASTGGSPITGYTATASPGGATCTAGGSTFNCTVTGLTSGTPYTFTVVAANAVGPGPASAPASATPVAPPPPPTAPGAPTGLVATPGNGQVGLTWVAPASTGGSPITGYTATASPGGATCTAGGSTFNCTVTGLTSGTPYTFTVVAANAVGPGPASAPASATPVAPPPPPTAPGAPTGLVATPGNGQVGLTWVAPASTGGSPITGYRVYRGIASGGETLRTTLGAGTTTFADAGLTNGTTYYYQVTAVNAVGESPRSTEVSARPATVPTAPRSLSASTATTKGVRLTWLAPTSTGGAAISGYRIYRSTSSGTETFLVAVGVVTTYTDTATTAGTRYYYKVAAVNAVGTGPLSAESNARAR